MKTIEQLISENSENLRDFEGSLRYKFADIALLQQALRHARKNKRFILILFLLRSRVGVDIDTILTIPQPFIQHNAGMMQFGRDGFLYIATGDGGSGGDPFDNAQDLLVGTK